MELPTVPPPFLHSLQQVAWSFCAYPIHPWSGQSGHAVPCASRRPRCSRGTETPRATDRALVADDEEGGGGADVALTVSVDESAATKSRWRIGPHGPLRAQQVDQLARALPGREEVFGFC